MNGHRRALIVVTGQDRIGLSTRKTGLWLSDVSRAHRVFTHAGYECDILSPKGGRAPVDERSLDLRDPANHAFLENGPAANALGQTLSPRGVLPGEYGVVFFAGGHGALGDFADDDALAGVALEVYERGGVLAASGHGVAALIGIQLGKKALLDERDVTGFSAAEETLTLMRAHVPYLLETRLRELGAVYASLEPFSPYVRKSGRIITGQNPQSTQSVVEQALALVDD